MKKETENSLARSTGIRPTCPTNNRKRLYLREVLNTNYQLAFLSKKAGIGYFCALFMKSLGFNIIFDDFGHYQLIPNFSFGEITIRKIRDVIRFTGIIKLVQIILYVLFFLLHFKINNKLVTTCFIPSKPILALTKFWIALKLYEIYFTILH